jgi:N-acetylmuramoyl-L-alanine amidase
MKKRKTTNRIILHHSLSKEGDVETITKWHLERGFEDIGYHFVILKDGTVEPGRDIDLVGAHASGRNSDSIGICLIGNFQKNRPDLQQITKAQHLIDCLRALYDKKLILEVHRKKTEENPCPGIKLYEMRDLK